jgi:SPP1 gp7 family putative phage head morphogenesis protein
MLRFKPKKFKRLHLPIALENEYIASLSKVGIATAKAVDKILIPELRTYGVMLDASKEKKPGPISRLVKQQVFNWVDPKLIEATVASMAQGVDTYHKNLIIRRFKEAIGVGPWINGLSDADVKLQLSNWMRSNADLIESIPEKYVRSVENLVNRNLSEGTSVKELVKQIKMHAPVALSKARLLARDQTMKLYGNLNQVRQVAVGVTKYTWETMEDSRVREMHEDLAGTIQSWDNPPVTNPEGETNHPGGDYQCRCTAEPILDDLLKLQS